MSDSAAPQRSRVPWALALVVGLCSGLAGYVIHVARVKRIPKQVVTVSRLTDMPGAEESPAISPEGTKVAFAAGAAGKRQIWVQGRSGAPAKPITTDDADHSGPRWSPDANSLIYFSAGAIWEIPAAGGNARRVVDALRPGDLNLRDRTLAFLRRAKDGVELNAGERTLVTLPADGTYSNLRWSPDGKNIAYLQNQSVMVVGSSGGQPVRAVDVAVQGFTWAPDNSGLIVSTRGELWFMPRKDGDSPAQLTFGEVSYESPDIAAGKIVAQRSGLGADPALVVFTGLRW